MRAPGSTVAHPLIREGSVAERTYQLAIAAEAVDRNTLVILPTGMGKTVVALLVMAERVRRVPGKVLLLAPTKPLAEQHAAFLRETFLGGVLGDESRRGEASSQRGGHVAVLTGEVSPEEREIAWLQAAVLCATPQVVRNDVLSGRARLHDVSLVVFDEAHRATGNYAYGFLADAYRRARPDGLVLGMTASPGADPMKVREVCRNLGIEGVEVRTEFDEDTSPYVQDMDFEWKEVDVPESIRRASTHLRRILDKRVAMLRKLRVLTGPYASKKALLASGMRMQQMLREMGKDAPSEVYAGLSAQAAALKVHHALELVETQGVAAFESYCARLEADDSKAARLILAEPDFGTARALLARSRAEHPKMRQTYFLVKRALDRDPDARVIVFTNYRDIAETLTDALAKADPRLRPVRFVGQQSKGEDRGLTQKQQVDILDRFRGGEFNVLVATSVAEEGLDIPSTDLVVFYEPVASEIRAIQRRGRTGRNEAGRVVVLITKGTSDESMHWASRGKEKRMRKEIDALQQHFDRVNASLGSDRWKDVFRRGERPAAPARAVERPLEAFARPPAKDAQRLSIVVDNREFAGRVAQELGKLGVTLVPETLDVADYVLSDRVAVERKTSGDYESSLMDGRLFQQVKALRDAYQSPLLVIEGGLGTGRIQDAPLYGSLASIATDFRVPVVTTRDASETARLLHGIAKREVDEGKRPVKARHDRGARTDDERLRYIVEGLPDVSAVLARRLLARFGTVEAIATATEEDLMQVEGIGRRRAAAIRHVLTKRYEEEARE